ncbi:MAG: hypothetical protein FWC03_04315 [Treponema sp.]|nr:hypothetical protein [Treponema sp.]
MMEMCFQNLIKQFSFLFALVLLVSCGVMDGIMSSNSNYRVNARVNDLPIDEYSIINSSAKIQPYFDNVVSNDPDITALSIFLRNSRGEIAGWKVVYTIDTEVVTDDDYGSYSDQGYSQTDQESQSELDSNINDSGNDLDEGDELNENDNEEENEFEEIYDNINLNESRDIAAVAVETQPNETPYRNGDQLIIKVNNLDDDLPYFPIPWDLPMGRYTLVSQVMSGEKILHRNEKIFYFLANAKFSFDGINVHHSGIAENHQLISKEKIIMLEAKLDYDSRLDPYIVWYNGRKIISEGSYSQGAGNLLWKTPEQTGFFSIRAEIFPVADRNGLAGFVRDISLLVSSRTQDMHFVSKDASDLLYLYLLEGDLNDSKMNAAAGENSRFASGGNSRERALRKVDINAAAESAPPRWMPADGIFGLASGFNNSYSLPDVSFSGIADNGNGGENRSHTGWRFFGRFKPLNNGVILSVQFGTLSEYALYLILEGSSLIMSLTSSSESVSEVINLLETGALDAGENSFINTEINFSALPDRLIAKLNVINGNNFNQSEKDEAPPISLDAEPVNEYRITLGSQSVNNTPIHGYVNSIARNSTFTAIWDELALFYTPFADTEISGAEDEEPDVISAEEPSNSARAAVIIDTAKETPEEPLLTASETEDEEAQTESEALTDSQEDNPFIADEHHVSENAHLIN